MAKLIKVFCWTLCLFINSRTAIAGAIIGLLLFFFISSSWFLLRPYDVNATICSFVHAISTELHVWRHFSLLVERVFCSCAWLNFSSHLTYLTLKNDFLTLKLTFNYFNSKRWGQMGVCHSKWRLFEFS